MSEKLSSSIALRGYEAVLPNEIYSKDNPQRCLHGRKIEAKTFAVLGRYTRPTREGVQGYLVDRAIELQHAKSNGSKKGGFNDLEMAILGLPNSVQEDLRAKNPPLMDLLAEFSHLPQLAQGEKSPYLFTVHYGIIPVSVLKKCAKEGLLGDSDSYMTVLSADSLIGNGLGESWKAAVLLDSGRLPSKGEFDILLKHGTLNSDTFNIRGNRYDAQEVKGMFDAVYSAFGPADKFDRIPDSSMKALRSRAFDSMAHLHSHILINSVGDALQEAMAPRMHEHRHGPRGSDFLN